MSPGNLDESLQVLVDVFPDELRSELQRVLQASRGNLERATNAILARTNSSTESRPTKRKKTAGLDAWLGTKTAKAAVAPSGAAFFKAGTGRDVDAAEGDQGSSMKSAFELLAQSSAASRASEVVAPQPAQLPPLTLATAEQVAQATNGLCTLVLDVLPKELAARLFLRMVRESLGEEDGHACASHGTGRSCEGQG